MSEEIMTCPQCGATVQAPARFCVTCGIKLPESMATHDDGGPVDPRAGWTTRDTSGWTTPPPGAFDFEDPTIIDVEPIPVIAEPPVSRWASWPTQPERGDDETPLVMSPAPVAEADDYVVEASVVPPIEYLEVDEPDEGAFIPAAAAEPSDTTPNGDPALLLTDASADEESLIAEITPAFESLDVLAPQADVVPDDPVVVPVAVEPEDADAEIGDDFEAAGWIEEEASPEMPGAVNEPEPFEETELDTVDMQEDLFVDSEQPIATSAAIERANQLLDELRTLIPAVAGSPSEELAFSEPPIAVVETPSIDLTEIKAAAVEARGEISFDNFSALRATIDEATQRPRDVEVMLKLSQRVDDIVALLAERDRLQMAFDDMLSRLDS